MTAPVANDLRVTVTDSATIFTGATTLHRFDAPSPRDIAKQIRNTFGPDPDGAQVHLTASREQLAQIEAALGDYPVALTAQVLQPAAPEGVAGSVEDRLDDHFDDHLDDDFGDHFDDHFDDGALRRPGPAGGGERWRRDWAVWIIGAVVVAAAVACAVAIAATSRSLRGGAPDAAGPDQAGAATGDQASRARASETEASGAQAPRESLGVGETGASSSGKAPPRTAILERNGVRLEVPAGFTLAADGPMWRATGLDPDFRLEIAVDELYNLPPETMAEQLTRDVEADPQTELVDTDGRFLVYRERPADGSEVLWKTWSSGNRQVFIGCHTRAAPTKVQQATCRMAMDSATFTPG